MALDDIGLCARALVKVGAHPLLHFQMEQLSQKLQGYSIPLYEMPFYHHSHGILQRDKYD